MVFYYQLPQLDRICLHSVTLLRHRIFAPTQVRTDADPDPAESEAPPPVDDAQAVEVVQGEGQLGQVELDVLLGEHHLLQATRSQAVITLRQCCVADPGRSDSK